MTHCMEFNDWVLGLGSDRGFGHELSLQRNQIGSGPDLRPLGNIFILT